MSTVALGKTIATLEWDQHPEYDDIVVVKWVGEVPLCPTCGETLLTDDDRHPCVEHSYTEGSFVVCEACNDRFRVVL